MKRRNFLALLIGIPFVKPALEPLDVSRKFAWDKISLHGIPYHVNNGPVGTWMGINRTQGLFWVHKLFDSSCIDDIVKLKNLLDNSVQ